MFAHFFGFATALHGVYHRPGSLAILKALGCWTGRPLRVVGSWWQQQCTFIMGVWSQAIECLSNAASTCLFTCAASEG